MQPNYGFRSSQTISGQPNANACLSPFLSKLPRDEYKASEMTESANAVLRRLVITASARSTGCRPVRATDADVGSCTNYCYFHVLRESKNDVGGERDDFESESPRSGREQKRSNSVGGIGIADTYNRLNVKSPRMLAFSSISTSRFASTFSFRPSVSSREDFSPPIGL